MKSGLGFGRVDLFQSNTEVKGTCYPSIHSIPFIHQLFLSPPHAFIYPPSSITPFMSPLLNPSHSITSLIFSSISLFSSSAVSLCRLLCPPYIHPSIPPSIQPSSHVLIPSSIHASLPLCPFMRLSLVKKQHGSQTVQPATHCCFVFLFLSH